MLQIKNNSQQIIATNFWDTEYNAKGLFYCSINARCFRILVPDAMLDQVPDMKTGKTALIERDGNRVVITFDDGSDAPYRLDLSVQQFDRLPSPADSGRIDLTCALWTRGPHLVFACPATYHSANKPY